MTKKLSPAMRKMLADLRRRTPTMANHEIALSHWDNMRTVRALEARGLLKIWGEGVELMPEVRS